MTWVLTVWFWIGYSGSAPSMIAVPGFKTEADCLRAGTQIGQKLQAKAIANYGNNLSVTCVSQ